MEKSFRGKKHVCSNCDTKFFDFNKETIICPNCKTEIVLKKKTSTISDNLKVKEEVGTASDDIELSEEVEFDEDELNEVIESDTSLDKEWNKVIFFKGP